ncbi:aspartyl protease family protein [Tsuneonella aeria]|uniref:aspartyl protease family protein n=1 Tax=Tsuneonella aeria TaxID=1837929 RepID=UPI00136EB3E4
MAQQSAEGGLPAVRIERPPAAQIDDTLAIDGEEIAARRLETRMTVAVLVDGTGPYRFVVDSGADSSVLGGRIAGRLALAPAGHVTINGVTERRVVETVRVGSLQMGQVVTSDLAVPVLQEQDLGADGVIGLDALAEQRLVVDFAGRTITVEDTRRPTRRVEGEIVVTARRRRGQLILTSVRASGTNLEAIIDTGSEITIGNTALRERLFRRYRKELESVRVTGVTGTTMDLPVMRVPELRIGSITMRDVPVAFADIPPFAAFGMDKEPALLLGTDLMANFRTISLDFKSRKIRFQLRRCAGVGYSLVTRTGAASRLPTRFVQDACAR